VPKHDFGPGGNIVTYAAMSNRGSGGHIVAGSLRQAQFTAYAAGFGGVDNPGIRSIWR
jgi:hypothetical protein